MGRVNGINLYKHGIARTYLNLDDAGNCFVHRGKGIFEAADFSEEICESWKRRSRSKARRLQVPMTTHISPAKPAPSKEPVFPFCE